MKISELITLCGLIHVTNELTPEEKAEVQDAIAAHKNYAKYRAETAKLEEPTSERRVKAVIRRWDKLLNGFGK